MSLSCILVRRIEVLLGNVSRYEVHKTLYHLRGVRYLSIARYDSPSSPCPTGISSACPSPIPILSLCFRAILLWLQERFTWTRLPFMSVFLVPFCLSRFCGSFPLNPLCIAAPRTAEISSHHTPGPTDWTLRPFSFRRSARGGLSFSGLPKVAETSVVMITGEYAGEHSWITSRQMWIVHAVIGPWRLPGGVDGERRLCQRARVHRSRSRSFLYCCWCSHDGRRTTDSRARRLNRLTRGSTIASCGVVVVLIDYITFQTVNFMSALRPSHQP